MNIVTHSTKDFTWIPGEHTFVAERSDFNGKKPWTVLKEGNSKIRYCYLQNPVTGCKVLFIFLHTEAHINTFHEIRAWIFGATPEEIEKNPRLHGIKVNFLND